MARVLILTNAVPESAGPEDQDTLLQRDLVAASLERIGNKVLIAEHRGDLAETGARLKSAGPDVIVNLVEQLAGEGANIHWAPSLLESLAIPFTGSSAMALALSNDKLVAKRLMRGAGLPTPDWFEKDADTAPHGGPWIVKSQTEHASHGLDSDSVIAEPGWLGTALAERQRRFGGLWFAERFIEGREFNLSLIEREGAAHVLPIAEMQFLDWPAAKPRLMSHDAKWSEGSFDYEHTRRRYVPYTEDPALLDRLGNLALQAWRLFGLSGYGRVDFRIDQAGTPAILEVNANPGLGPEGGMPAACEAAGIDFDGMMRLFLQAAIARPAKTSGRHAA